MDEEFVFHIEQATEQNIRAGMDPVEARRQALIALGGVQGHRESMRDGRGFVWLTDAASDARYAARTLAKSPGFTMAALLTLALGIGANTAIFSVVNAVLLKPLPYPEPGELVQLRQEARSGQREGMVGGGDIIGSRAFVAFKTESRLLARVAAYAGADMNLTGVEQAERVSSGAVTAEFFPLLGIQPMLGRNFVEEEDSPNGPRAVILGHGIWQSRFGGDRNVLGRTVTLNEQSFTVVGVMPQTFQFPEPFQFWVPLALDEANAGPGMRLLYAIGRLGPGVTVEQAQTELRTIAQRTQPSQSNGAGRTSRPLGTAPRESSARADAGGRTGGGPGAVTLVSLHERIAGPIKQALLVLLGAVGMVLLIACANVANLLLARATVRQREMAVRAALGAGRWRVIRQLLTESVLLSMAGGAFGLALAFSGVEVLGRWAQGSLPTLHEIRIDGWVLAFTLGMSIVTGLIFGLAPAFQGSRADVNTMLKNWSQRDAGVARPRLRHALVISEVAIALVLLIGAGLLIRSFALLREVDPGFRADGVLTMQVGLAPERFGTGPLKADFIERLLERLQALPGVEAAAVTDHLPLTQWTRMTAMNVEGRPPWTLGKEPPVSVATVSAEYFEAMRIPLRAGRALDTQDASGSARAVLVNEAFAESYFPDEGAIGKRIADVGKAGDWLTIAGVVSNVRQNGLENDVTPEVYHPKLDDASLLLSFVVRTSGEPPRLAASVRAAVTEVDRDQPVYNLSTMEERLANTTRSRRLTMTLLGSFAAIALVVAMVGIYGVISYAVARQTREIGLRMALGAQKGDVLGLVVRRGLRLTLLGIGVGLAAALALTRYLSSLLYAVTASDPLTFAALPMLLVGVALLASWLPARRAATIDPMKALRCE